MKLGKGYTVEEGFEDISCFEGVYVKPNKEAIKNDTRRLTMLYREFYTEKENGEKTVDDLKDKIEQYLYYCCVPEVDIVDNDHKYSVYGGPSIEEVSIYIKGGNTGEEFSAANLALISSKMPFDKQPLAYMLFDNENNIVVGYKMLTSN